MIKIPELEVAQKIGIFVLELLVGGVGGLLFFQRLNYGINIFSFLISI